jgi:hypothetical protein
VLWVSSVNCCAHVSALSRWAIVSFLACLLKPESRNRILSAHSCLSALPNPLSNQRWCTFLTLALNGLSNSSAFPCKKRALISRNLPKSRHLVQKALLGRLVASGLRSARSAFSSLAFVAIPFPIKANAFIRKIVGILSMYEKRPQKQPAEWRSG